MPNRKQKHNPNLKAQNAKLIGSFVIANGFLIWAAVTQGHFGDLSSFAAAEATLGKAGLITSLISIFSLVINALIPSQGKAVLIFWRLKEALPGHRAFTHFVNCDPRVNVEALESKLGEFPVEPKQQNALWYKLFKENERRPEVEHAHQLFLLFRDLAVIALMALAAALGVSIWNARAFHSYLTLLLFLACEYLVLMVAARNLGNGFVRNVLAVYAAVEPKKPGKKKKEETPK